MNPLQTQAWQVQSLGHRVTEEPSGNHAQDDDGLDKSDGLRMLALWRQLNRRQT